MKKYINTVLLTAGFLMAGGGLYIVKSGMESGIFKTLPYILIGLGCGLFGQSLSTIISGNMLKKDPKLMKKMDIEKNDERNISISNAAKGKAYDIMTFVYGALMLIFALMNIELSATLMLTGAYLFVQGTAVFWRIKLDKIM